MFPTSPYKQHFLSPRLPHYAVFLTQLVQHKLWDPFPRPECSRKESQTSPKIWLLACQSWSAQAHSACLNTGNKKYLSRALPFDPSKAIYVGSIPPNVMDDLGTSFQAFGRICCVIPMSSETALVVFFTPELLLWYFSPISSREVPKLVPFHLDLRQFKLPWTLLEKTNRCNDSQWPLSTDHSTAQVCFSE